MIANTDIDSSPSYRGFVQICVGQGDEQETFDIHEFLITIRSPFFKEALSGKWKEAAERMVKLPEDDPATFKLYVHLLYTCVLAIVPDPVPQHYNGHLEHIALVSLYVLAEKLQDTRTRNSVLEATLQASRLLRSDGKIYDPGLRSIGILYAGTMAGSPMRRLLVDIYTARAKSQMLNKPGDQWPSDFMRELALSLLDKRQRPEDATRTCDASLYMEINEEQGS